jgi:hypothetical protein
MCNQNIISNKFDLILTTTLSSYLFKSTCSIIIALSFVKQNAFLVFAIVVAGGVVVLLGWAKHC